MKRLATSLLAVTTLFVAAPNSHGAGNANAKMALHLMSVTTKNTCTRPFASLTTCFSPVTAAPLYPELRFAYILVTDGSATEGIAGLQFGIQYGGGGPADGVGFDVFAWVKCTDLEFVSPTPVWPSSGGGNLMTWVTCQTTEPTGPGQGAVAVAGYFYCAAYSPDCLSLTPRPVDGAGKVANCAAVEDVISGPPPRYGIACFGGGPGFNPWCIIDPVENTTWSGIKSIYADN